MRATFASLSAALVLVGLAVPVSATEPTSGSGAFTLTAIVTTGVRSADGNLFITQIQTYTDTGLEAGVETDVVNLVVHQDGTFNATADVNFAGTFAGVAGTLHQHFETTGGPVSFQGQLQTLSGTGGLVNLRGEGTFQGMSATFAGTYTFQYHFDP